MEKNSENKLHKKNLYFLHYIESIGFKQKLHALLELLITGNKIRSKLLR